MERLTPAVYDELRRLAAWQLHRERPNHTLQPTALVHEALLRLMEQERASYRDSAHLVAVAAGQMRRVLVDYARRRSAAKRSGLGERVEMESADSYTPAEPLDFVRLDDALISLQAVDPRACRIVELRFFAALTVEEVAAVLSLSEATVKREWEVARRWLLQQIRSE
ncbi:MAG: sigma-70 family RNA polymerase sigma factor [Bryobacterales bacterium]|nr:sigma-70 family RNA polymerase sigma factor [Bryobacterales bacterium]